MCGMVNKIFELKRTFRNPYAYGIIVFLCIIGILILPSFFLLGGLIYVVVGAIVVFFGTLFGVFDSILGECFRRNYRDINLCTRIMLRIPIIIGFYIAGAICVALCAIVFALGTGIYYVTYCGLPSTLYVLVHKIKRSWLN